MLDGAPRGLLELRWSNQIQPIFSAPLLPMISFSTTGDQWPVTENRVSERERLVLRKDAVFKG